MFVTASLNVALIELLLGMVPLAAGIVEMTVGAVVSREPLTATTPAGLPAGAATLTVAVFTPSGAVPWNTTWKAQVPEAGMDTFVHPLTGMVKLGFVLVIAPGVRAAPVTFVTVTFCGADATAPF
jgi:hypothetical protein